MTEEQYKQAVSFWERRDEKEKKMEGAALYEWIDEFLSEHKVLAFASGSDELIRCTPLEYGWHEDALWIFTEGGYKFRALRANRNVAAAIFDPDASFGKLKSVQIKGTAEIVEPFSEEYNNAAEKRNIPASALQKLEEPMWLLKIIPSEIVCLNSEFKKDGYGSRQVWRA